MRQFLIILIFSIITISCGSQTTSISSTETIYLWSGKVPGETDKKHDAVKTPDTSNNVTRLTNVTNPILEVFKPSPSNNNGAGIIICPGGGYQILAIDLEGYEIAKWLNTHGFTAFVLQYRVPDKQSGALMDLQRATRVVRSRAAHYQINPEKIGVLGFSAGGSLAARASTNFNINMYKKVDTIDEISCKPNFAVLIYPAYLNKGKNDSITPELTVTRKTPPMFIFATADDPYANRGSLVMSDALMEANIPVELHLLPLGGHGYGLREDNVAARTWTGLAEVWLHNILK